MCCVHSLWLVALWGAKQLGCFLVGYLVQEKRSMWIGCKTQSSEQKFQHPQKKECGSKGNSGKQEYHSIILGAVGSDPGSPSVWAGEQGVKSSDDWNVFSSVQFSRLVVTDSLRPHESQHARPPCPSRSLLKLMAIESAMPSSHLILCRPLLLLPPIPPSIRVFSSESTLRMR